jgi:adenine-specific DNA-methyltransferase
MEEEAEERREEIEWKKEMNKKQKLNDGNMGQLKLNFEHLVPKILPYGKILHGDCLEKLNDVDNGSISLVFCSPPYNIGKSYEKEVSLDDYLTFQKKIILLLCAKVKNGGSLCWQVGNYVHDGDITPLDLKMHDFFLEGGLVLQNRFIWTYGHGLHCKNRFSGRYETVSWYFKGDDSPAVFFPSKYAFLRDEWEKCLLDIPNVKSNHIEKTSHPCQFPVELVQRFVLALTKPNDIVLDPFCGVGSTVAAALLLERNAIGIEIMKDFVKVAESRVEKALSGALEIREMGTKIHTPDQTDSLSAMPTAWKDISNPSLLAETNFEISDVKNSIVHRGSIPQLKTLLKKQKFPLLICFLSSNVDIPVYVEQVLKLSAVNSNICFVTNGSNAANDVQLLKSVNGLALKNRIVAWNRFQNIYTNIYWFTKGEYHFDLDAVRVPSKYPGKKSSSTGELSGNPLGKNPTDVWRDCCGECDQFYGIAICHFKRMIRAWSEFGSTVLVVSPSSFEFDSMNIKRSFCNYIF